MANKTTSNIHITNRTRQCIPIQVKPPNGDFFYEEQQFRLMPGKSLKVPRNFLNWSQIKNCQGRGDIAVVEE